MKKLAAITLALAMLLTFAGCNILSVSDDFKIKDYVDDNRFDLIAQFEEPIKASGLSCNTDIEAEGTGFVITVKIVELDNLDEAGRAELQAYYDETQSTFNASLRTMQKELPELTYYTVNICDTKGNVCATIKAQ